MRYGIWNNKGGVGKTFLSFVLSTEYAKNNPKVRVVVADMCPQANLSEILLGGNGKGAEVLDKQIKKRQTVGGYFDARITSPHSMTGRESGYLLHVKDFNQQIPDNLWLIAGDPSLELQAQVINQISAQTLPEKAWKNVHNWLLDLVIACSKSIEGRETKTVTFVDCNPSFSAYTELAMAASERIIVPCSSDGSSARAIDNMGSLLYGLGNQVYSKGFSQKAKEFGMSLPMVHSVLLNRSTQYNREASKAFGAMFDEIKRRTENIRRKVPEYFVDSSVCFSEIPDGHSVAVVCSHLGCPLFSINPGKYPIYDERPQINPEPLERYRKHVAEFLDSLY
ncbi:MAG: ParA family protein [Proteobacteria bacterium]|nr:ParA family protein [Cystobacterineae bacterium]MCL2258950.1 ParA family protein [Cystobacterineae bacterium]MCL2314107.1 ParA family protein [Pseudomonadota bacterium]